MERRLQVQYLESKEDLYLTTQCQLKIISKVLDALIITSVTHVTINESEGSRSIT